ncbi:HAD family hydrolase [Paenibacillus harenae]|uniref:HAD family hydrolase n=1 Tax=Paenibacillus harenae TaxID=306543 RepID=UPI00278E5FCF|nr:HAD-IA family hydrolase [Paenibacillus harenae]MDQ0060844.1 putative hydrolase of the HAD superfamily [Paenibacillus harenae]
MRTKAVIFDLFETLITEFDNGMRASKRNYNYMELLGLSNEQFKKEWASRQHKRMTGEFPHYHSVIEDVMKQCALDYNEEAVDYLYAERVKEKRFPLERIRPDIVEVLEQIRASGIKLGLISNCTEEEVHYWRASRLAAFFDEVIFSFEVGLAKPDERIYRLCSERLGVKPEHTIFVGDGGSSELEGASKAGMRPVHAYWFNTYIQSEFRKLNDPKDLLTLL